MNASIIWYRARPSDELEQRLKDTLASVKAEVVEENVTIKAEQIASLLAAALRTTDITVTVGGMDLRRDEENIIFLASKCIRVPLEKGRYSRSGYIYDPMRGARLPSFETAVLFPSAGGGAEGAVLVSGAQTIIMLPRLESSNADILDLIADYLPMLLGIPEEPEPEPEEEKGPHDGWVPSWDGGQPQKEYYDENGNRLPEYIERVLARKENLPTNRGQEISGKELYALFKDDEPTLSEDNLEERELPDEDRFLLPEDHSAALTAAERRQRNRAPQKLSAWEQMFEDARAGGIRTRSAQRYEDLLNGEDPLAGVAPLKSEEPEPAPSRKRNRQAARRAAAPAGAPEREESAPSVTASRKQAPLTAAKRTPRTPDVGGISLKSTYKPAAARTAAVLPEPSRNAPKTVGQTAAPAFRAAAILLILSIIISTCYVAFNGYEPAVIEDTKVFYQSELAAMYDPEDSSVQGTGDETGLPFGAYANFAALYAENNDVSGYISIPGTDIAQPVMRSYASSPDFYSSYSFYGKADQRGSLYFDSDNVFAWGETNANLIVYGNSPMDGSMFAGLHRFTDAQYLSEHPIINLDTLYEKGQWLIFAVCLVSSDTVDEFNYSNTDFIGQYARHVHLYNLYIRSMFYTNTEVLPDEKILTLVTDSDEFSGAKLLVCARKVRDGEDLSQAGAGVIENPNVMMPDLWYSLNNAEMPNIPELEVPTSPTTTGNPLYTATTTTVTTTAAPTTTAGSTQPGQSTAPTAAQSTTTTAPPTTTVPTTLEATTAKNMRITSGGKIVEGPADDVLAMIIEAEMGAGYELEALKAQAVASYTYYLYAGGSAKAPTFPTKQASDKSLQAAQAVLGQYMSHGGFVPYTPYYATSAGMTANNYDINVADLSWLTSVDCSVDESVVGFRTEKQASAAIIAEKVKEAKGIDLTAIEDKSTWFEIVERDANDLYVLSVRVGDQAFKGNTLHLSILGYSYLRSPCFWIEYDEATDMFHFTSLGYGSGVGMSQTGANEYAKQGRNYVWILQHFYPGVSLKAN